MFSLAGEHPLIDDSQIDMDEDLCYWAHEVVEEYIGEVSTAIPSDIEPAVDLLEHRLIASENPLPVRFVILNFLYRLAHFTGFGSESSARGLRSVVWPHLERFVRLQEINALDDPRSLRWEITNAGVIQDWDRAMALIDRLKSLGLIDESGRRALKGQLYVCSVVAPRKEAEDQGEEERVGKEFPGWWVPKMDRAYFPEGDLGSCFRPPWLTGWGMKLKDDAEYSRGERERLSDAAHEWDVCFDDGSHLLGAYRAAWGKCHFLSGDYLRAAKQFDELIDRGFGLPSGPEIALRPRCYLNAAECLREGGDTSAAIRHLEQCGQEFPTTAGLWLKLAKLYLSRPLEADVQQEVLACLRKEEEIDPNFGEDPRASIAFTLAELGGTRLPSAPPSRLLHPLIASRAQAAFDRGEYDDAVFKAFKEVEVAVRSTGAYGADAVGVAMIRDAFAPAKGPLTDSGLPRSEQESEMHLFAAAIGLFKNPHSHRSCVAYERAEAVELLLLASHLLRRLDRVKVRRSQAGT